MSSNPNDYYFSQETGSQIPLNPVVRGLSTIQEAYASSSQSQSQTNNSQQMSVASATKEDGASKKMDDSFNHHVEDYYDHDPVNDLWLQEQGLLL